MQRSLASRRAALEQAVKTAKKPRGFSVQKLLALLMLLLAMLARCLGSPDTGQENQTEDKADRL